MKFPEPPDNKAVVYVDDKMLEADTAWWCLLIVAWLLALFVGFVIPAPP